MTDSTGSFPVPTSPLQVAVPGRLTLVAGTAGLGPRRARVEGEGAAPDGEFLKRRLTVSTVEGCWRSPGEVRAGHQARAG